MNTNDAVAILRTVRNTLQYANDNPNGGINDTIWMMDSHETLFDFIDAALAATDSAATVAKDGGETRSRATDAEIAEWALRHNIGNMLGNEARSAFEDAESLHMTYATPKPEASAATQQAVGEVILFGADSDLKEVAWAKRKMPAVGTKLFAAPISEDTGKVKESYSERMTKFANSLPKAIVTTDVCLDRAARATPAAQVSDGDAMPPLPEDPRITAIYKLRDIAERDMDIESCNIINSAIGEVCQRNAARTVTGSGGSIGEDADFVRLLKIRDQMASDGNMSGGLKVLAAIIGYIDARTARNAGVAAPDTSARDALPQITEAQILEDTTLRYHFGLNGGKGPVSPKGWGIIRAVLAILDKSKGGA